MSALGRVSLVGAGPGDPGLITVKALECIRRADVVVYDRLVNKTLLDHARPDCELVYVGKQPGKQVASQPEINDLLASRAKAGKYVVRLKSGDPFIFGRGGEEAEALAAENVPFEVVPGVSSVSAVPAYAGIPVTHRDVSSSLAIVTGHEDPSKPNSAVDWARLATATDTIVILMGVSNLSNIVGMLMKHGRSPDTPVALVRWGTTSNQETLEGTLSDVSRKVAETGFSAPAVAIVGDVVRLRDRLNWLDAWPLLGKRVLVTRSRKQASTLSALLAGKGAQVIELPALEIRQDQGNRSAIDGAIDRLAGYKWAVFTSVNGVELFLEALNSRDLDGDSLRHLRLAAIGPATAAALESKDLKVDLIPEEYVAETLVEQFKDENIEGQRLLLPRAAGARAVLVDGLTALGAIVDEVPAYRAELPLQAAIDARDTLINEGVDVATFASSSTVRNLAHILNGTLDSLHRACIACIGPVTAATAKELGLRVDVVASEHTIPGLVDAIVDHLRSAT